VSGKTMERPALERMLELAPELPWPASGQFSC
jgi:hypothetical protein